MLNRKQEENEKLRSKHEDGRCLIRRVLRLKTSSFVSKIIVSHFRGAGSVEQDRSPLGTWGFLSGGEMEDKSVSLTDNQRVVT